MQVVTEARKIVYCGGSDPVCRVHARIQRHLLPLYARLSGRYCYKFPLDISNKRFR